jgi:SAM-dependent methyltransferase
VLRLARPGDTWLDVGAGAGRYAFPLALAVREVIAVDPSTAMVAALSDGLRDHGIGNVRVVAGRWPEAATTLAPLPCADVALIASVGHDTEAIGPFVDALEAAAGRGCVAVMHERAPALLAAPFFEAVYGEPRIALPSLPDFLDLLAARGAATELEMVERPARRWRSREELLTILRRQTWVAPGGRRDGQLVELVERSTTRTEDGFGLATGLRTSVGIVRWSGGDQAGMDGAPK